MGRAKRGKTVEALEKLLTELDWVLTDMRMYYNSVSILGDTKQNIARRLATYIERVKSAVREAIKLMEGEE